jgi:hypothetical protein
MTSALISSRSLRNAIALTLLLGLAVPQVSRAEDAAHRYDPDVHISSRTAIDSARVESIASRADDAAHRYDPDVHISGKTAIDPTRVGSIAARGASIATGSPITTADVDPNRCGPGQLVLNFTTGALACEWTVAK